MNPKRLRFVQEYLIDLNATQAAIRAGYSARSAEVTGSRLLGDAKVAAEIAKRNQKRIEKLDLSAERVLGELMRLAFFDPRKFWNEDGSLKKITELDDDTARALQGFEVEKLYEHFGKGQATESGTVSKIKMADKGLNLERLGRHLKLFTDKVEVSGLDGLAERLARARQRTAGA